MDKLWKHQNGVWYVLTGPRLKRRVSTGQRDRREAEKYLTRYMAGSNEPTLSGPTVQAVLEGYRDDHGKGLRGQDGLNYGVKALIAGLGDLAPDHLTPTVIKRYAKDRGAKDGTILREVGVLRAALAWAKNHKMLAHVPAIPNPVRRPPPRHRWLSKVEAGKLLAACTEPHIRLFVVLGLTTVARMSAILEAEWSQVDWERGEIDYGEGHGNKRRTIVPLNPQAVAALKLARELACSPRIIEYHGKPVTAVKKGFASACSRAGLQGVTPHVLRHSGASWMAMDGVPLSQIAKFLGDSEAIVERVYAKWTPGYLRQAANALQFGPGV